MDLTTRQFGNAKHGAVRREVRHRLRQVERVLGARVAHDAVVVDPVGYRAEHVERGAALRE